MIIVYFFQTILFGWLLCSYMHFLAVFLRVFGALSASGFAIGRACYLYYISCMEQTLINIIRAAANPKTMWGEIVITSIDANSVPAAELLATLRSQAADEPDVMALAIGATAVDMLVRPNRTAVNAYTIK